MRHLIWALIFASAAHAEGWNAFSEFAYRQLPYLAEREWSANAKRDLRPGASVGISLDTRTATDSSSDYDGMAGSLMFHREQKGLYWFDASGGVSSLTNRYTDQRGNASTRIFLASVSGGYQFHERWNVQLHVGQDYIFPSFVDPSMARAQLSEKLTEVTVDGYPGDFHLKGMLRRTWLSDGNRRGGFEGFGLYSISPSFRAGVNIWEINFDERRSGYWTPVQLTDYALRTEFGFDLAPRWHLDAALQIGRSIEPSKPTGNSSLQEFKVSRQIGAYRLGMTYTRYSAFSSTFSWWRQDTSLNLAGSF